MNKRIAIPLGAALLLGAMTAIISAGAAPGLLRVTGPVLCPSGSTFVMSESPEVEVLPDNRRVAPVHFACIDAQRRETEPHLYRAVLVLFLGVSALYFAGFTWMVRRLLGSSRSRD